MCIIICTRTCDFLLFVIIAMFSWYFCAHTYVHFRMAVINQFIFQMQQQAWELYIVIM